jgi:hypothetical protein
MGGSSGKSRVFGRKKNLTEINHKVSLIAKRWWRVCRCVCAEMRGHPNNTSIGQGNGREAVMQDALVGSWAQDSHLSPETLGSLHDINHRFLDFAASRTDWLAGLLAPLSAAQRAAAAECPYALFDLRFQDERYWQLRLRNPGPWRIADEPAADAAASFVRLALFYAWHVASSTGLNAQLLLGMHFNTAAAFRRATLNLLPALAATEAQNLSARWGGCMAYWSALANAASRPDAAVLRRVQLYGLQLAAGARLPAR